MKSKSIFKFLGITFGILIIAVLCYMGISYYYFYYSLIPENGAFKQDAHYINPKEAFLSDGFEVCNTTYIYQYYNGGELPYITGKNNFRNYLKSNYTNKNYTDSGYLNIRFVVNCKGEAGRYVIHENDLDLNPKQFNKDLINQLFSLTSDVKQWKPLVLHGNKKDYYTYVSYRIEHGEITEIIP